VIVPFSKLLADAVSDDSYGTSAEAVFGDVTGNGFSIDALN
jgi:hypothetical protein